MSIVILGFLVLLVTNLLPIRLYRNKLASMLTENEKVTLQVEFAPIKKGRKHAAAFLILIWLLLFFENQLTIGFEVVVVGFQIILLIQNILVTKKLSKLSLPRPYVSLLRKINHISITGFAFFSFLSFFLINRD